MISMSFKQSEKKENRNKLNFSTEGNEYIKKSQKENVEFYKRRILFDIEIVSFLTYWQDFIN